MLILQLHTGRWAKHTPLKIKCKAKFGTLFFVNLVEISYLGITANGSLPNNNSFVLEKAQNPVFSLLCE